MTSHNRKISRRLVLAGAAAGVTDPLLGLAARKAWAQSAEGAKKPIYIADMHYHLFFLGRRPAGTQPLGPNMAAGQATLVSWALVGDQPWLRPAAGTFKQAGTPRPGQAPKWLREEMTRVKAHLAESKLSIVKTKADVAAALAGKPHVVLSTEGATFADEGASEVKAAFDLGVRHVQLVHFIANRIGDFQTEPPQHNGLTAFGHEIVAACNTHGILIDLAHCTDRTVDAVLEASTAPVVWSHSSLAGWKASLPFAPPFAKRQLSQATAKRIADKGGVVGLWALAQDVGASVESYTDRILDMAGRLGDAHVAFGTDMNALGSPALQNFSDLRRVVDLMVKRGTSEETVRRIAIENYARALTAAMVA